MTASTAERPGRIRATAVARVAAVVATLLLGACGTLPRDPFDPAGPRPAAPAALLDLRYTASDAAAAIKIAGRLGDSSRCWSVKGRFRPQAIVRQRAAGAGLRPNARR